MGATKARVVFLFGPPGAGKGTQADLLEEREGFVHFETAKVIEEAFASHGDEEVINVDGKSYTYGDERQKFASGVLNTPEVVVVWVKEKVQELHAQGKNIVFSGSPRTMFEAEAELPLFEELYGRDAIYSVRINVPKEVSIARNSKRRVCTQCRAPIPNFPETKDLARCPKCGGELTTRVLDSPEVIPMRLKQYQERTVPIFDYLKRRGVTVADVDGVGTIGEVEQRIIFMLT